MVPVIFFAAALLLSGCASLGQKKSEPPGPGTKPQGDPESPSSTSENNLEELTPDAGRIKIFEGLTLGDFQRDLLEKPEKKEALEELGQIISGGDPKRIDPGLETARVGRLFGIKGYYGVKFSRLLPLKIRISPEDVSLYYERYNQEFWDKKRDAIKKEFQLDLVQHPFAQLVDQLKITNLYRFRGLPAFDSLAEILLKKFPGVEKTKSLQVLYPASGAHVAPLMTALKLIDMGKIDQADFIYTELDEAYFESLQDIFEKGVKAGVLEKMTVAKPVQFANAGSERVIELIYKGHPIRITFAHQRSGDDYYREEYLKSADLIVIHDPANGYLSDSFSLVAQVLIDRKKGSVSKSQWVVMEGAPRKKKKINFPTQMEKYELPGPYGHCQGFDGVGEILDCEYSSAQAFLANDPELQKLVSQFPTRYGLSEALYPEGQDMKVYFSK